MIELCLIVIVSLFSILTQGSPMKFTPRSFNISYEHNTFLRSGSPFRYVSGSIHYSRVPSYYWGDRLMKMHTAGLDAVQVYIPWNIHEPVEGQYDFEGQQDLIGFLEVANSVGLLVILRPGPYICAEWDFGGLPPWIIKNNANITLRTMDPAYIGPVERWFSILLPKLKPLLYSNNGPIIMIQVENEYGSYFACDHNYLAFLRDLFHKYLGDDALLFTTDGDGANYLKCGKIPGVYATVDFGPGNVKEAFKVQRQFEPKGPLVNSEFYTGWLDYWGSPHAHTATDIVTRSLDEMLSMGANVNMYMFEGGTNFGYTNGADPPFNPVPTSYDYDAPLTEAGDVTEKYMAIRKVISKYKQITPIPVPPNTPKYAYGKVQMIHKYCILWQSSIFEKICDGGPTRSLYPMSMEELGQNNGFIAYKYTVTKDMFGELSLPGLRDRAYITLDELPVAILDRNSCTKIKLQMAAGQLLGILVENMGHINYGSAINDNRKGLVANVTMNGTILQNWEICRINLTNVSEMTSHWKILNKNSFRYSTKRAIYKNEIIQTPSIFYGKLELPNQKGFPQDTYLKMNGWSKGQAFINGFNLGRYWPTRGPQVTLYVPAGVLKPYPFANKIMMVELQSAPCGYQAMISQHQQYIDILKQDILLEDCMIEFVNEPIINATMVAMQNKQRLYPKLRRPYH